ncbi:hypothetical protein K504DRAFT_532352 [Pleomassaria siparia CBS 279.74]|uniref:DUF676 domain-containing protein n=1 Tax=Pleomassaria siparia CBS 279.74 TaxID=1314801 RepID=A0A6G1KG68_9PLEO|nr:hypothetical protein K504DRAFT_532352 [Pleomassaria siparia CBS 279.74]
MLEVHDIGLTRLYSDIHHLHSRPEDNPLYIWIAKCKLNVGNSAVSTVGTKTKLSFTQHAHDLMVPLNRVLDHPTTIILYTYSIGIVPAKRALRSSHIDSHPSLQKIPCLPNVIVFFGTPHHGSNVANLAEITTAILSLAGHDLRGHLATINKIVTILYPQLRRRTTCPRSRQGLCLYNPNYLIDEDHQSMDRYSTAQDTDYRQAISALRHYMSKLDKKTRHRTHAKAHEVSLCMGWMGLVEILTRWKQENEPGSVFWIHANSIDGFNANSTVPDENLDKRRFKMLSCVSRVDDEHVLFTIRYKRVAIYLAKDVVRLDQISNPEAPALLQSNLSEEYHVLQSSNAEIPIKKTLLHPSCHRTRYRIYPPNQQRHRSLPRTVLRIRGHKMQMLEKSVEDFEIFDHNSEMP